MASSGTLGQTKVPDSRKTKHELIAELEALRKSEKRFRLAVSSAAAGFWDWNVETGEAYLSPRWLETLGYEPGDLTPHVDSWKSLIHPDDLPRVMDALEEHFDGQTSVYECENRLRMKSGAYRWNLDRGQVIARDGHGKPLRMVGFDADISRLKEVERTLGDKERELATLMSNLPGMAYRCRNDSNWSMEFVSDGSAALTGYAPADLVANQKLAYGDLIHPEDKEAVWKTVQTAVLEKRPFTATYRIRTAASQIKWVWERGAGVFSTEGALRSIEGFVSDVTDRRQARIELEKSESRFRSLVENAPDCIHLVDLDGRVRNINKAGVRMLGLARSSDVDGKKLRDYVSHEDRSRVAASLERAFHGEAQELAFTARTARGARRCFKKLSPIIEEGGEVSGLVAMVKDVTESEKTQHTLQAILDNAAQGIILANVEGRIVLANPAAEQSFGYSSGELIGRSIERLVPPETATTHVSHRAEYFSRARSRPMGMDVTGLRKDGTTFPVEISLSYVDATDAPMAAAFVSDVTERRRVDERNRHYAALVKSSNDAVISTADQTIRSWNPAAERLFGYKEEEVVGKHISVLIPSDRSQEPEVIQKALERGETFRSFDTVRLHKDGSRIPVMLTVSDVVNDSATVVGRSAIIRDVRERKRTEERLRELAARLLTVQEEERRRISRELHDDLGQKLTLLRMQVDQFLAPAPESSPEDGVPQNAETMRELVDALADQVRRLSHQLHPSAVEHLGLAVALKKECDTVTLIAGKAISFRVDESLPRRPPLDVGMCLYRVAQEAIGNAIKHSGSDRIEVALESVDRGIRLTVEDWGEGFETDDERADGGLGLVSMGERARLVNGRFELETRRGGGTRVRCWAPLPKDSDLE